MQRRGGVAAKYKKPIAMRREASEPLIKPPLVGAQNPESDLYSASDRRGQRLFSIRNRTVSKAHLQPAVDCQLNSGHRIILELRPRT